MNKRIKNNFILCLFLICFLFIPFSLNNVQALKSVPKLPSSKYTYIDYTDTTIFDFLNQTDGFSEYLGKINNYMKESGKKYAIYARYEYKYPYRSHLYVYTLPDDNEEVYKFYSHIKPVSSKYDFILLESSAYSLYTMSTVYYGSLEKLYENLINGFEPTSSKNELFLAQKTNYNEKEILNASNITSNGESMSSIGYSSAFGILLYSNIDVTYAESTASTSENIPFYIKTSNGIFEMEYGDKLLPLFESETEVAPKLIINEKEHEEVNGKYASKTYEYSFDIFYKEKYKYYYSNNKTDWVEMNENLLVSKYEFNMILYFKVTDIEGNVVGTYFHEINDINTKITDETLDHSGVGFPDYGEQSSDEILDDDSTFSNILGWFVDLFEKRFGIIFQIKEIYDSWLSYDPFYDNSCHTVLSIDYINGGRQDLVWRPYCNMIPSMDLSPIGIKKEVQIIDVSWFWKYRDEYFFWVYLSLSTITLFKVVKNVKYALGGGSQ